MTHEGPRPHYRAIPLTVAAANRAVRNVHRHHGPVPPALALFSVGCVNDEGRIVGVAVVGRPANHKSDDGQTGEVLRVASDGSPNSCSFLLGVCARVATQMGFSRLISYTLDSESGSSPDAANMTIGKTGIKSWWNSNPEKWGALGRSVVDRPHMQQRKTRWERELRTRVEVLDETLIGDGKTHTKECCLDEDCTCGLALWAATP